MKILLLGGGLDSITLLVEMALTSYTQDVVALLCNYGQKAFCGEQVAARYFCHKHNILLQIEDVKLHSGNNSNLLFEGTSPNNCIPGRNLFLIVLAAQAIEVTRDRTETGSIYIGYHQEPDPPPFPDATEQARSAMETALKVSVSPYLQLIAPYSHWTREEILAKSLSLDEEIAERAYTCYAAPSPTGAECGICTHCILKAQSLRRITKEQISKMSKRNGCF